MTYPKPCEPYLNTSRLAFTRISSTLRISTPCWRSADAAAGPGISLSKNHTSMGSMHPARRSIAMDTHTGTM